MCIYIENNYQVRLKFYITIIKFLKRLA